MSGATAGRDALREAALARAIYDPGKVVERHGKSSAEDLEPLPAWQLRAVLAALDGLPDTPGEERDEDGRDLRAGAFIDAAGLAETYDIGREAGAALRVMAKITEETAAPAPAARPAPDEGLPADLLALCERYEPSRGRAVPVYALRAALDRAALAAPDRAEHAHRFSFGLCMEQGCAEQEPPAPSPEDGAHRDTLRRVMDAIYGDAEGVDPDERAMITAAVAAALAADPVPGSDQP